MDKSNDNQAWCAFRTNGKHWGCAQRRDHAIYQIHRERGNKLWIWNLTCRLDRRVGWIKNNLCKSIVIYVRFSSNTALALYHFRSLRFCFAPKNFEHFEDVDIILSQRKHIITMNVFSFSIWLRSIMQFVQICGKFMFSELLQNDIGNHETW